MNENKICFITCVNDERMYEESLVYIRNLNVPKGFEIELIALRNQRSMTSANNYAMQRSDAKYKVYLHQDVFIINKDFISDFIKIFQMDENIGILGVAGSRTIPTNGIWWESEHKFGRVYGNIANVMEMLDFNQPAGMYEGVTAIDGLIMVTQYDLPWREDLFDGWHFYDISQSMEFIKQGYKVSIPYQGTPWCVHDCGIVNVENGFDKYRKIFIHEYSNQIYPLVSILIPAYNQPEYFTEALESAINQTYNNIEIVVCDDSTNNDIEKVIKSYTERYPYIKYYNNGGPLGKKGALNLQKCFDLAQGRYINFLLHDDLFCKDKIEKMIKYFVENDDIAIVTSYRKLINQNGKILNDLMNTKRLFDEDCILDGELFQKYILINGVNCIGEMTTAMFDKNLIEGKLLDFYGLELECLGDVGLWLKLLGRGRIAYLTEEQSYFRIHQNQNTNDTQLQIKGALEWLRILNIMHSNKYINMTDEEYRVSLRNWIINNSDVLVRNLSKTQIKEVINDFLIN